MKENIEEELNLNYYVDLDELTKDYIKTKLYF